MKQKSKYLFDIIWVVYILLGVMSWLQLVTISDVVLLGLSVSALLIALSNIIENLIFISVEKNTIGFMVKQALFLISNWQENNVILSTTNVKIGAVINNVKLTFPYYTKAVAPKEYAKKWFFNIWGRFVYAFFATGIACFILAPYMQISDYRYASALTTIFAFAAMCFNLSRIERINDLYKDKWDFQNNTILHIESVYQGFQVILINRLETLSNEVAKEEAPPHE